MSERGILCDEHQHCVVTSELPCPACALLATRAEIEAWKDRWNAAERSYWAAADAARDKAEKRVVELTQEVEECNELETRLGTILRGVAVSLKGEPKPLHEHSWHDLPEKAAAEKAAREKVERELARVRPVVEAAHYAGVVLAAAIHAYDAAKEPKP